MQRLTYVVVFINLATYCGKSSLASQTQPTPARIAFSILKAVCTESDLCWGWLGLACETTGSQGWRQWYGWYGNGTAGMAMAVPVFEGEKWRRLDSNLCVRYRMASPSGSP